MIANHRIGSDSQEQRIDSLEKEIERSDQRVAALKKLVDDLQRENNDLAKNADRQNKIRKKKNPEVGRIYEYVRVSHDDSVKSGLGIEAYIQSFETWISLAEKEGNLKGRKRGVTGWEGGWKFINPDGTVAKTKEELKNSIRTKAGDVRADGIFLDLSISARNIELHRRPAGSLLLSTVRNGDLIVVPNMERGFRSTRDFLNTQEMLRSMGVTLMLLSPMIDMSTATGQMLSTMLAGSAEYDSSMKSERNRLAYRSKALRGDKDIIGWKDRGKPDWLERLLLNEVIYRHEALGIALNVRLMDDLEVMIAAYEDRAPFPRGGSGRKKRRLGSSAEKAIGMYKHAKLHGDNLLKGCPEKIANKFYGSQTNAERRLAHRSKAERRI